LVLFGVKKCKFPVNFEQNWKLIYGKLSQAFMGKSRIENPTIV
jgi:hypothetical protein